LPVNLEIFRKTLKVFTMQRMSGRPTEQHNFRTRILQRITEHGALRNLGHALPALLGHEAFGGVSKAKNVRRIGAPKILVARARRTLSR
jgi:hypothetical protein